MAEQRADGSWEHTPEPPEPEAFRDCVPVEVKPPPSPGPTPERAAAELASAEASARTIMRISEGNDNPARAIFGPLLAELDRQRALIAAVLAECARRESVFSGPAYTEKWVETHRIRALLEGEER